MKKLIVVGASALALALPVFAQADDLEFLSIEPLGSQWDPNDVQPGQDISVMYSARRPASGEGAVLDFSLKLNGVEFDGVELSVGTDAYQLGPAGSPVISAPQTPGSHNIQGCLKYVSRGDDANPGNDCMTLTFTVAGTPPPPTGANGLIVANSIAVHSNQLHFAVSGVDNGCGGNQYRTPDTASTYPDMYVAVLEASAIGDTIAPDTLSCDGNVAVTQSYQGL